MESQPNRRYPLRNRLRRKDQSDQKETRECSKKSLCKRRKDNAQLKEKYRGKVKSKPPNSVTKFTIRKSKPALTGHIKGKKRKKIKGIQLIERDYHDPWDELFPELITIQSVNEWEHDLRGDPVSHQILRTKMRCDTRPTCLTSIAVLNVKSIITIVVVDQTILKSIYTDGTTSYASWLDLHSCIKGMSKYSDNRVILAAPDRMELLIYDVTPGVKEHARILTSKGYCGVAALSSSTLVASSSSSSPGCVDFLDLSGNILKTFTSPPSLEMPFETPEYLHVTKEGNILVTDHQLNYLGCLTPDWKVVFENYKNKSCNYPLSVTSFDTGDILLLHGRERTKIVRLTSNGEYVREVIDNVATIADICVEDDHLYVATKDNGVQVNKFCCKYVDPY